MKKILVVFGTRPEAIKLCPLIKELKNRNNIHCAVCVTGQHKEMLYDVLRAFSVQPEYDLSIMLPRQTLFDITTTILTRMERVLLVEHPDMVLVHGDTATAFATALACFYLRIPLGHVEAGLRTYDLSSPFPEEMNRRTIALLAQLHFAPTEAARRNLLREGVPSEQIFVTGNTAIDALHTTVKPNYTHEMLDWAKNSRLLVITTHRRENIGTPMQSMLRGIRRAIEDFPDCKAILPLHPNPAVQEIAKSELGGCERLLFVASLSPQDFHNLMARCYLVLTDSGGIQEEAPALGKPVLVLRDTTERMEGVRAGTLRLIGTTEHTVFAGICDLLSSPSAYSKMANAKNPYGDGTASLQIANILESHENCTRGSQKTQVSCAKQLNS